MRYGFENMHGGTGMKGDEWSREEGCEKSEVWSLCRTEARLNFRILGHGFGSDKALLFAITEIVSSGNL